MLPERRLIYKAVLCVCQSGGGGQWEAGCLMSHSFSLVCCILPHYRQWPLGHKADPVGLGLFVCLQDYRQTWCCGVATCSLTL